VIERPLQRGLVGPVLLEVVKVLEDQPQRRLLGVVQLRRNPWPPHPKQVAQVGGLPDVLAAPAVLLAGAGPIPAPSDPERQGTPPELPCGWTRPLEPAETSGNAPKCAQPSGS
jgi:hypothetical protein